MRVALSAGHHPKRWGASRGPLREHPIAARFTARIAQRLIDDHGIEVHAVTTGPLPGKIAEVNSSGPFLLAAEVHLNACGRCGAVGAETLYMPGTNGAGKRAAALIQREMAMAGAEDRGVKEGHYQMDPAKGPDYWLAKTNCPAVIIEPAFIDAEFPMDPAYEEALCAAIAAGIAEYCHEASL